VTVSLAGNLRAVGRLVGFGGLRNYPAQGLAQARAVISHAQVRLRVFQPCWPTQASAPAFQAEIDGYQRCTPFGQALSTQGISLDLSWGDTWAPV